MTAHTDTPPPEGTAPGHRRPADRRQQIISAAAKAFSASSYHSVRLEDIAEAVGMSAPALYRHFPTKYALFAETTTYLANALVAAIADIEPGCPDELDALLAAITAASIENRRTGRLYRWESRYLEPADAAVVRDAVVGQHRRVRSALLARRPELSRTDANVITAAMISVMASPLTHRVTLAHREIQSLITDTALSLIDVELPDTAAPTPAQPTSGLVPAAKREQLLSESINLFAARGFRDVTIEEIGAAVGMPASGVYRHFSSKTAILEAAFWRATDRFTSSIADALAASTTPREAISQLITRYVQLSCDSIELITVYVTEIGHVSPRQQTALRNQQRITVEEWATWVGRERPDISPTRARFLVHAAFNVVADLARAPRPPAADRITALGLRILLGEQIPTD
ncbi:TetR/AcrR family transcriptional regulator [Gordonia sp. ABSL1-1]|uniref:TetR/AcrR family transcriptional regulator n=1 Tax=Gordonia sp. ABSL1-1 TaxID=3053923 RepID=UPI002572C17D|nr:TetR/AcrR family transcriptional regulator [Gordonia sp. ABSL1-1]MDL9935471.1 TetR/AcrR family transcriptional regulator [Gordonia sp. ABSL1-1]